MAQNNGYLTSKIRESTYASEEKASEIKTQTHVINESVEWSILFVLIVPEDEHIGNDSEMKTLWNYSMLM